MDNVHDLRPTNSVSLSQALLTGLFAGMIATVICIVFNIVYRDESRFALSEIINVSSLIFGVNLVFLLIGAVYYMCLKTFQKGDLIFIVVFLLLTVFLAWRAMYVHRADDAVQNREFHNLLLGVIVISGLLASLGIPWLYHNKKFRENVV